MVAHGSTVRLRSGLAAARRAESPGTRTSVFAAEQAELGSPRCKQTGAVWQVPHLPEHGKPGVDRIHRSRAVRERAARRDAGHGARAAIAARSDENTSELQ